MDRLLAPDFGLMFWTAVTFLLLAGILAKFAWGPLVSAIEEREKRIQDDRAAAEKARDDAERIKAEFEKQVRELSDKTQQMLIQAQQDGKKAREDILKAAQEQAKAVSERTRAQLDAERDRLIRELRVQVADLTAAAAERLLKKTIDREVQDRVMKEFFADLDKQGSKQ